MRPTQQRAEVDVGHNREPATVETGAYPMDPEAKLDTADVERQVAWFKAQKLIDDSVITGNIVDTSFAGGD
mgnify:CR=1 FL=1